MNVIRHLTSQSHVQLEPRAPSREMREREKEREREREREREFFVPPTC